MNYFLKYKKYLFIVISFIALIIIYLFIPKEETISFDDNDISSSIIILDNNDDNNTFYVDIKGAVNKPGVYEFSEGDMVVDAISSSGGLKKNASTENINLSKKLAAEMVIYVKTKTEIKSNEDVSSCEVCLPCVECSDPSITIKDDTSSIINNNDDNNSLININTATINELVTLNGIGESKAKAIIEYRTNTPFKTIEDIKNVSGLGDTLFEKIKNNITV